MCAARPNGVSESLPHRSSGRLLAGAVDGGRGLVVAGATDEEPAGGPALHDRGCSAAPEP